MSIRLQWFKTTAMALSLGLTLALGLSAPAVMAEPAPTQYKTLRQAQPTDNNGKVEVLEFFWYECPHCNEFEPVLDAWEKKQSKDVSLKRVPVAFRPDFTDQQKLFYTLEALGRLNDLHVKVFQEIHVNGNRMRKPEQMVAWAEKQGIDRKKFMDTFQSFSVAAKVTQAQTLSGAYQVDSVPMLAVDGQYTTSASIAGGTHQAALQVVDFLVGKAKSSKPMVKK